MKKLLFVVLASCAIPFSNKAQVKFGATAGATMSNYGIYNMQEYRDYGISVNRTSKTMACAGLVVEIPVAKNLNVQPAFNYMQYGTSVGMSSQGAEALWFAVKLNSVELPVNFIYTTQLKKGRFFIGAGPSVSYHVSGKAKSREGSETASDWVELKLGSSDDADMRRWNIGANFIAGIELSNHLFFAFNYNAGLTSLHSENMESKIFTKSQYLGLRIGYFFDVH